jgi:cobalt-zinc-cadmium efflux system protein
LCEPILGLLLGAPGETAGRPLRVHVHHDHGGHDAHSATRAVGHDRSRRLILAIVINAVIVVGQVIAGFIAHSIGLIADAAHSIGDIAGIAVSLLAVRLATRAPSARRTYGNHRATILAAQANGISIIAISGLIVYEAIRRLINPVDVDAPVVVVVAVVALIANLIAARTVDDHTDDLNMRSAALHLLGDAFASAGVVVAGVVIWITNGNEWLDPVASLVVAALISWRAVLIVKQTAEVFLESVPAHLDTDSVRDDLQSIEGVVDVHDLHIWAMTHEHTLATAHLMITNTTDSHSVLDEARHRLTERHHIAHATLQVEPEDHRGCDNLDW